MGLGVRRHRVGAIPKLRCIDGKQTSMGKHPHDKRVSEIIESVGISVSFFTIAFLYFPS